MVVAERIRPAEIILCAGVIHRGIVVAIQIHLGLALDKASVVPVKAHRQRQSRKASAPLHAVQHCVSPSRCDRMLLPISRVEVHCVLRYLAIPAGDHVIERLFLLAAVLHRDAHPLAERHLEIAVQPARRCDGHHGRAVRRIFSIAVSKLLIIRTPEKRADRRFHGRLFAAVPIAAHHETVPRVSRKPDVRHHTGAFRFRQRHGLPRRNVDACPQLFAVLSPRSAVSRPGRVLRRKSKALPRRIPPQFHVASSLSLAFFSLYYSNSNPALQQNNICQFQASVLQKGLPV